MSSNKCRLHSNTILLEALFAETMTTLLLSPLNLRSVNIELVSELIDVMTYETQNYGMYQSPYGCYQIRECVFLFIASTFPCVLIIASIKILMLYSKLTCLDARY